MICARGSPVRCDGARRSSGSAPSSAAGTGGDPAFGLEDLFTEVIRHQPVVTAELGDKGIGIGLGRKVTPASCNPAAHPSGRLTNADTLSAPKCRPVMRSSKTAESVSSKERSDWRISVRSRCERCRSQPKGGSTPAGHDDVNRREQVKEPTQVIEEGALERRWRSSTMMMVGGSSAICADNASRSGVPSRACSWRPARRDRRRPGG